MRTKLPIDADFSELSLDDAFSVVGEVTYVVRVNPVWHGHAIRVTRLDKRVSVVSDGSVMADEWRLERYENGELVSVCWSPGA